MILVLTGIVGRHRPVPYIFGTTGVWLTWCIGDWFFWFQIYTGGNWKINVFLQPWMEETMKDDLKCTTSRWTKKKQAGSRCHHGENRLLTGMNTSPYWIKIVILKETSWRTSGWPTSTGKPMIFFWEKILGMTSQVIHTNSFFSYHSIQGIKSSFVFFSSFFCSRRAGFLPGLWRSHRHIWWPVHNVAEVIRSWRTWRCETRWGEDDSYSTPVYGSPTRNTYILNI